MPNRIISDITWKSKKVRQLSLEFRAEYTWTLPLFNEWGAAEYDAESIWHSAYALNRPDWTAEKVQKMCEALVSVGLWATWEQGGHTYVYLVGSHKPGLLPKPSDRNLKALRPPADLLAKYCGGDPAPEPPISSPTPANGIGDGSGTGDGLGIGMGKGDGSGDMSNSSGTETASLSDRTVTQAKSQPTPEPESLVRKMDKSKSTTRTVKFSSITARELVGTFYRLLKNNPAATATPAEWQKRWTPDFEELVKQYGGKDAQRITFASQEGKYAQYIVRGKTLLDYSGELAGKLGIEPFDGTYPEIDYSEVPDSLLDKV